MRTIQSLLAPESPIQDLRWKAGETITRGLQSTRRSTPTGNGHDAIIDGTGGETVPPFASSFPTRNPLSPRPAVDVENPVLTVDDVSGHGDADFVADPFLFVEEGVWHLFFEISNRHRDPPAVIGHATSTDAGRTWSFTDVVLRTDTHLAFPYVFEWDGTQYMIPDRWDHVNGEPRDIKLYRATSFPDSWAEIATLVSPTHRLNDFVAFRFDDRWWGIGGDGRELYAYYSDELTATDWTPHRENPVVSNRPRGARPGGRPIVSDDRVLLFLQDCVARYGSKLRAFEVVTLTPAEYDDHEHPRSPVLEPNDTSLGWNAGKMHHLDPVYVDGSWRCAVDGNIGLQRAFGTHHWSIGIFDA